MKNYFLYFCLCLIVQFLFISEGRANPRDLITDYFEKLESVIRIKDYKAHKKAMMEFYGNYLDADFQSIRRSEYDFISCHEEVSEIHEKTSLSENRKQYLDTLFPKGAEMHFGAFDHKLINMEVNEKTQEMKVLYSLDLGGTIVRTPGRQTDIEHAPLIELRKCDALFSFKENMLKMKSEKCEIVVKEGSIIWETKDFVKEGCEGASEKETMNVDALKHKAEVDYQVSRGIAYYTGRGAEQSYEKAFRWFMKAAEGGSLQAQNNIGAMYSEGQGVPQNDTEAIKWFRKAAEQGDAVGQKNLGEMYELGKGIKQNDTEALKWYKKSAAQGYENAQRNLDALLKKGSSADKGKL